MDFRDVITLSVLADYLTAPYGHDLAVWSDGLVSIMESSLVLNKAAAGHCAARVKCPGMGNLDAIVFSDGYAYRNESGLYLEIATERVIGDLADLIRESCMEGDVTVFMDELIEKCRESAALPF